NVSYALPNSVTNELKIKQANIFFNGTNLFVISKMTEFHDPEQQMYDSYPVMKTDKPGLESNVQSEVTMKNIFFPVIFLLSLTSCKDVLDIRDLNSLDEWEVWQDPNLVNAYLANVYSIFGNWNASADNNSEQLVGITFPLDAVTVNNSSYKAWDYTTIRKINTALVKIEESTGLNDNDKRNFRGQLLFMRAYA